MRDLLRAEGPPLHAKAIVPPATTTDPTGAALLPPALLAPLIKAFQQATVLARIPGLLKVGFNIPVPVQSQAVSLKWVGQGAPKPATRLLLDSLRLASTKCAGILPLSEELSALTNSGAETVMAAVLTDATVQFIDAQFLDPTVAAVPGVSPASITHNAPPIVSTGDIVKDLAALRAAFYAARPHARRPTYIMSPASADALSSTGTQAAIRTDGGLCNGAPCVTTPGAGATLVLLDAAAAIYADAGAEVDLSRHAAIVMDDAPVGDAGAVVTDLWSRNLIGVRVDRFVGWAGTANAVAAVTLTATP